MASVTGRISEIKQPRGGYIKPSAFEVITMNDGALLNEEENIHGSIIGMTVDYLVRYSMGENISEVFNVALQGAAIAETLGKSNSLAAANKLLNSIKGIDDNSIISACKLVTFDVWKRNPVAAVLAKDYCEISPDTNTIKNIQIFIKRGMIFLKNMGLSLIEVLHLSR